MTTWQDVRDAMLQRCREDMPSWPDPHATKEPAKEEYSRVTNGQRYQIVVDRAQAWVDACAEELQAQITALEPREFSPGGWTLTSPLPGTTSLQARIFEFEHPAVMLGCGAADDIDRIPDCGCDACDSGSESLVEKLDDWFLNALTGGLAQIWGEGWSATKYLEGLAAGGATGAPAQMDFAPAGEQLDVIAAGSTPCLPVGLCWVWSGHWTD